MPPLSRIHLTAVYLWHAPVQTEVGRRGWRGRAGVGGNPAPRRSRSGNGTCRAGWTSGPHRPHAPVKLGTSVRQLQLSTLASADAPRCTWMADCLLRPRPFASCAVRLSSSDRPRQVALCVTSRTCPHEPRNRPLAGWCCLGRRLFASCAVQPSGTPPCQPGPSGSIPTPTAARQLTWATLTPTRTCPCMPRCLLRPRPFALCAVRLSSTAACALTQRCSTPPRRTPG